MVLSGPVSGNRNDKARCGEAAGAGTGEARDYFAGASAAFSAGAFVDGVGVLPPAQPK